MTIDASKRTLTDFIYIVVPGAIGGLLAWLFYILRGPGPLLCRASIVPCEVVYFFLCILASAGTALAFIVLISHTDRTDRIRVVALAFVAGFAWEPLLDQAVRNIGARNLQQRDGIASTLVKGLEQASNIAEPVASVDDKQRLIRATNDTVQELDEAAATAERINAPEYQQALQQLEGYFTERYLDVPTPQSLDSDEIPSQLPTLDTETLFQFTASYGVRETLVSVHAESEGRYRIEFDSDADLVASLYDDRGEYIAADDDSGDGLNPLLDRSLDGGTYTLRISQFDGESLPDFTVSLTLEEPA